MVQRKHISKKNVYKDIAIVRFETILFGIGGQGDILSVFGTMAHSGDKSLPHAFQQNKYENHPSEHPKSWSTKVMQSQLILCTINRFHKFHIEQLATYLHNKILRLRHLVFLKSTGESSPTACSAHALKALQHQNSIRRQEWLPDYRCKTKSLSSEHNRKHELKKHKA